MEVKELIKQLMELPQDLEIKVFDWRKNLNEHDGDDSGKAIYDFEVELHTLNDESKRFASITFTNIDYNSDGSKVK